MYPLKSQGDTPYPACDLPHILLG